jgi:hypothetical protein
MYIYGYHGTRFRLPGLNVLLVIAIISKYQFLHGRHVVIYIKQNYYLNESCMFVQEFLLRVSLQERKLSPTSVTVAT